MPITPLATYDNFAAGRQNRLQADYGRTRNALAEQELANAPQQQAQQNQLAGLKIQGAQQDVQAGQQSLDANQAKFAYAKLKQALDSGNPRAFVMQQIPDLAAKLQQQGIDLNSMDDQSGTQLIENLARKYEGEAGVAPGNLTEEQKFKMQSELQQQRISGQQDFARSQTQSHQAFTAQQNEQNRRAQLEAASTARDFTAEQNRLNREARAAGKSPNSAQAVAERQRTLAVYETARNGLIDGLEGSETGSILGRVPAMTTEQQIAEGGVAAMAPVLKQLFRSAGEGTFTDKDQDLLLQMVPTRKDSPKAARVKVANIDRIVSAKLGLPVNPYRKGEPTGGASGGWQIEEVTQ